MNPLNPVSQVKNAKSEPQFKQRAHADARPLRFEGKWTKEH